MEYVVPGGQPCSPGLRNPGHPLPERTPQGSPDELQPVSNTIPAPADGYLPDQPTRDPATSAVPQEDHAADRSDDDLPTQCNRRLIAFQRDMDHHDSRSLTDEEWTEFESRLERLVAELSLLVPARPPRRTQPTPHWRRRQQRHCTTPSSQPVRSSSTEPAPGRAASSSPHTAVPSQVDSVVTARNATGTHRRRRDRRTAKEARKIQRFYRVNKYKCIQSILGENSPRCSIPASRLQNHFN